MRVYLSFDMGFFLTDCPFSEIFFFIVKTENETNFSIPRSEADVKKQFFRD